MPARRLIARLALAGVLLIALAFIAAERWHAYQAAERAAQQSEALLAELRQLRQLLQGGPPRPGEAPRRGDSAAQPTPEARVSVAGRPSEGRADAPVTLVEFTDFQCPFCARFHRDTLPTLRERFIAPGHVRYVVVDLPLPSHPQSPRAHEAAHCAAEQGRYFALQTVLFANFRDLAEERFPAMAREAGVALPAFEACLASGRHAEKVRTGVAQAGALGINGTPTFIIGRAGPDGSVTGPLVVGAHPTEVFVAGLEAALESAARERR